MRIVIAGGSGQVGRLLAQHFVAQGHAVAVLTRRPSVGNAWREVAWASLRARMFASIWLDGV